MRVMAVPIVFLCLVMGVNSDEPGEGEMSQAVAAELRADVQGALDYVKETRGQDAVEQVKKAGTDRFDLRSFTKFDCMRAAASAYTCGFAVEIGVVNGTLRRTLTGRFVRGPHGLMFQPNA